MTYNMTFLDEGSTLLDTVVGANTYLADGWIGIILLIMIGLITFLAFKKGSTSAAFAVSSFITAVSAVFLFATGLIPMEVMLIPIVLTIIGVFLVATDSD